MKRGRRFAAMVGVLPFVFLVCGSARAQSVTTLIDFDSNPIAAPPSGHVSFDCYYGEFNVCMNGIVVAYYPDPANHSACMAGGDPNGEFPIGSLGIKFLTPQTEVWLDGGCDGPYNESKIGQPPDAHGTLVAYNGDEMIDSRTIPLVCSGAMQPYHVGPFDPPAMTLLEYSVADGHGSTHWAIIDNLRFTGNPPPPTPSTPPEIVIESPSNAEADYSTGPLEIVAHITGEKILPQTVNAWIEALDPRSSFVSDVTTVTPIECTEPGWGCTVDNPDWYSAYRAGSLPPGRYRVHVTAMNLSQLTGTATFDFVNRPAYLDGYPGPVFGKDLEHCQIAFLEDGTALARVLLPWPFPPGQMSFSIPMSVHVAEKWLAARATFLGGDYTLGCPTSTAVASEDVENWPFGQQQEFERGRIVTGYWSNPAEVHYMPKVFVDVAEALATNGPKDAAGVPRAYAWALQLGLPTADPETDFSADTPTYLFQRFRRSTDLSHPSPGDSSLPDNTLELRGERGHPLLYIARVGGDFMDAIEASATWDTDTLLATTPTVWETVPCSGGPVGPYVCPSEGTWADNLFFRPYAPGIPDPDEADPWTIPRSGVEHIDGSRQCPLGTYGWPSVVPGTDPKQMEWVSTYQADNNLWPASEPAIPSHIPEPVEVKALIKLHDKDYENVPGSFMSPEDEPNTHYWKACDVTAAEAEYILAYGASVVCDHPYIATVGTVAALPLLPPGTVEFIGGLFGVGASANNCEPAKICSSDWNLHTRPLPKYWNHLASSINSDTGEMEGNYADADFEIEWEYYWGWWVWPHSAWLASGSHWRNYQTADPEEDPASDFSFREGDLVYVRGRHIMDCGHPPYRSEIHPPSIIADMRRKRSSRYGAIQTRAQVWVNSLFEGGPVTFSLWAPPRPNARAELVVLKTRDDNSANNIGVDWTTTPTGVDLTFTSDVTLPLYMLRGQQLAPSDMSADNLRYVMPNNADNPRLHSYVGLWKLWWDDASSIGD
jgi:hypothetical protein